MEKKAQNPKPFLMKRLSPLRFQDTSDYFTGKPKF